MRMSLSVGALLVIGVTAPGAAGAQLPGGPASADSAQVAEVLQQFLHAFVTLDWDAFRATWAQHPSVFFPMNSTPDLADGRSEVDAGFQRIFARARAARARRPADRPPPTIRPRDLRITVYGTAALVTFVLGPPNGRIGRRTLLLVKEESGWKIAHLHGSMAGGT